MGRGNGGGAESVTDVDSRLRDVERAVATHGQQIKDLTSEVHDMREMRVSIARVEEQLTATRQSVGAVQSAVEEVRDALDDRDQKATEERKANRTALYALTGVLGTSVVGAVVTLLTSGGTP